MAKNCGRITRREKITLSTVREVPHTAKELKADPADLGKLVQRGLVSTLELDGKEMFYLTPVEGIENSEENA